MSRKDELRLIKFILEQMEDLKDHPGRERYCVGFDASFENLKKIYTELTGKEWQGPGV